MMSADVSGGGMWGGLGRIDDDDDLGPPEFHAGACDERKKGVCAQERLLLERVPGAVGRRGRVEQGLGGGVHLVAQHQASQWISRKGPDVHAAVAVDTIAQAYGLALLLQARFAIVGHKPSFLAAERAAELVGCELGGERQHSARLGEQACLGLRL